MAHIYVQPKPDGPFLPQAEVISRLIEAFPVHAFDQEAGQATATQMIRRLEELRAPADLLESYRQRQRLAVDCYISDDGSEDGYLNFTLWPDEPIFIGFHSARHEEQSRPLLERLAEILDYETA